MANELILGKQFKTNLVNAMVKKDIMAVNIALKQYKLHNGVINYNSLLSIPSTDRLQEMAKFDLKQTAAIIGVALTTAFETMNLSRPMNAVQILDLTDTILESSSEDNLAYEDVVLFLQKLTRGEYGAFYESMDIPKFMDKFEIYRQQRHEAFKNAQYEKEVGHKPDKSEERISETREREEDMLQLKATIERMSEKYKNI